MLLLALKKVRMVKNTPSQFPNNKCFRSQQFSQKIIQLALKKAILKVKSSKIVTIPAELYMANVCAKKVWFSLVTSFFFTDHFFF